MERQSYQTYCGPEGQGCGIRIVEKCRECRGRLVKSGEELACVKCGVVARTEAANPQDEEITTTHPASHNDEHLGSYMGTWEMAKSHASFNGNSTVGYVKRLSDHLGEDHQAWNCSAIIARVAERLSLPASVKDNAILLARRVLADRRKAGLLERKTTTIPTVSVYCLVSACRAGGVHRVGVNKIRETHVELGHRVTRGMLLRLGIGTSVSLGTPDIDGLLATVVKGLKSSPTVAERLEQHGVEAREYFKSLMELSKVVAKEARGIRAVSPRSLAAGSVYVASRRMPPKLFTQAEAAETLGVAEYTVREFSQWALHQFGSLKGGKPS